MLTLMACLNFVRRIPFRRVPLWLYEAAALALTISIIVHRFAVKEQELGAARERVRADSIQLAADARLLSTAAATRDSAVRQLASASNRLTSAMQTMAELRAIVHVTATTPDTVKVEVPAKYVQACDLIVASCDSVRRAAVREKIASDSVIAVQSATIADLRRQRSDGTTVAVASHSTRRSVVSGAIGALLGAAACSLKR